jgi:hypothetical protein
VGVVKPTARDLEKAREIIRGSFYENYEESGEVVARIAQALADCREECAKIAEKYHVLGFYNSRQFHKIAKAIREKTL